MCVGGGEGVVFDIYLDKHKDTLSANLENPYQWEGEG